MNTDVRFILVVYFIVHLCIYSSSNNNNNNNNKSININVYFNKSLFFYFI